MVPIFRLQPINTRISVFLLARRGTQNRSHIFSRSTNGHSSRFGPADPYPLRSGTSSITLVVVLVSAVFAAGGSFYLRLGRSTAQPSLDTDHRNSTSNSHIITMSNSSLPGRPGNLTADQEVKLQELWSATMRVFGISAPERLEDAGGDTEDSRPSTPSLGVKKKKRHNVFSRKHHDNEDDGKPADQDDKYGQSKEFQQILATANPEDLRRAFWDMAKHDHPDGLLLRFLRARKWDVHNALVMLIATMKWRLSDMRVDDDIMKKGEAGALADSKSSDAAVKREGNDFLAQLRLGKSFLHGTDKAGRPICFVRVRLHRQGEQTEASLERYTVYVIETARLVLARPVDTAVSSAPSMSSVFCTDTSYRQSFSI